MDVDLSTDLRGLLPLVAPLLSGHSDLAIGTRLARGARVVRGPRRELISRGYNVILHLALRARFSDAQCGFKAVRRDALPGLLGDVRDDGWFFDTELLVLAQRRGLRIHEVPVDWIDDPDSRVDVVRTALDDLRGVARLMAAGPVFRFMIVGVASTLAYAALFLALRGALGAAGANALALALTAVGNTAANRRLTFGVRGRCGLVRQHALGAVVFLLTLGLTSGALDVLHALSARPSRVLELARQHALGAVVFLPPRGLRGGALAVLPALSARPPRVLELAVLVAASTAATVTRYVALRALVFAPSRWRAKKRRILAQASSADGPS